MNVFLKKIQFKFSTSVKLNPLNLSKEFIGYSNEFLKSGNISDKVKYQYNIAHLYIFHKSHKQRKKPLYLS